MGALTRICDLFQTEAIDNNGDNFVGYDALGNFPAYKALTPAKSDIDSGFGDEGEQRQEEEHILGKTGTDSAGTRHFPKRLSRW